VREERGSRKAVRLAERAYPGWNASFNYLLKAYSRMPSHPRPPQFSAIQVLFDS